MLVLAVAACSPAPPAPTPTAAPAVALPAEGAPFDYQIGGGYDPGPGVDVVERDRRDRPDAGRYSICYVNAFQTQPADADFWLTDHADLVLTVGGRPVEDPDWPGEYVLDLRTPDQRERIATIVDGWFAGCAAAGYQAVEPDNLDSWLRSDNAFGPDEALALTRLLVTSAHAHGLAIAQKNAAALEDAGRAAGLDFAVVEECSTYDECGTYTGIYGGRVYDVEYTDNGTDAFRAACADANRTYAVVLRDRGVTPEGNPAHVREFC